MMIVLMSLNVSAVDAKVVETVNIKDNTAVIKGAADNKHGDDADLGGQLSAARLQTITDPATGYVIDHTYPVAVPSYLSLSEAQQVLGSVSPKLAANQAQIAVRQYQADATQTLDQPLVFARVSASAYDLNAELDLNPAKTRIADGITNLTSNELVGLPVDATPALESVADQIAASLPDNYALERDGQRAAASLGAVWPIYTAGRTQALQGFAAARTTEATADDLLDSNQLYTTLIERYFGAQLAIIAAYLREDALDTLQQTDYQAQRLYEEGFISYVERLSAKAALADASSAALTARSQARLAMVALQRLLRTPDTIKPTSPLFVLSGPLPDVDYFKDIATSQHPALQKVAAKQQQARALYALSNTGYKPTVALYGYTQVQDKPSWAAGVSATWKLTGGLDKAALLASGQARQRQAQLAGVDATDNILLLVEKNWHEVNAAQAKYFATEEHIEVAGEVLRLKRLGLNEGVNTTLDVVQAQTEYLKARTQQANAANDYVQALAALLNSTGTPLAFNAYMNVADIVLPTLYQPTADELSQIEQLQMP